MSEYWERKGEHVHKHSQDFSSMLDASSGPRVPVECHGADHAACLMTPYWPSEKQCTAVAYGTKASARTGSEGTAGTRSAQ